MSDAGKKRLEVIQEFPRDVLGITRMRGRHLALGRDVEVRFAESPGREGQAADFLQEMTELSCLDHPCFPPVLERGVARGRFYYAIPLRTDRPLSLRVRDEDFDLPKRIHSIWLLASSLSAMHRRGIVPAPLDSRELCWDDQSGSLRIRHHRLRAPGKDVFQEILEEDWCQPTPGGNVVQWAAFSYWLLSRGQSPLSRGRPVVLGEKIQGIHPDLASLIEVCLFGEEQARPATGPELMALLRLVPCGFLTTAPSPSPKREGPKSQPIELQRTLGDLRKQGNIARVPDLLEKPVKVLRDRLEALELLSVGELGERPSRAMAGIGLGLLALLCSLFLGSSVEGPAPRPETTEFSSLEVRAEDLRNDPYLVKLLRIRSVSAEDFSPIWNLVRTLAIQGRLPVKLRDQKRILAMHSRFPEDPDGACNQLEGLLEELRGVVGKE